MWVEIVSDLNYLPGPRLQPGPGHWLGLGASTGPRLPSNQISNRSRNAVVTFINTDQDWPRLEATHEDIILISAFPAFTSKGYKNLRTIRKLSTAITH